MRATKLKQSDTACYCCGVEDDPDGDGPAINAGFCHECTEAGCRDRNVGTPCLLAPDGDQ